MLTGTIFHALPGSSSEGESFKQPYTIEESFAVKQISDPQTSPDGTWIAYTVGAPNFEQNQVISHIWIVSSHPGSKPRQLTTGEKGESRPRWSPDGEWIAFTTTRSGSSQIWAMPAFGGEAVQISDLSTGAKNHIWSPKGNMLAFVSDVYPDCEDDEANKKKKEEIKTSGVAAKVIDQLLYRHWAEWRDGKRTHLFTIPFNPQNPAIEKAKDLTPGNYDAPPFSLGGPTLYAFSPDGKEIAYTRGADPSVEAWSTNASVWLVSVERGEAQNLTAENKGWNGSPIFSPDGNTIAYRSQEKDGYESDIFRLFLYDRKTGTTREYFSDDPLSAQDLLWVESDLYVATDNPGSATVKIEKRDAPFRSAYLIPAFREGLFSCLSASRDGKVIVALCQSLNRAPEIYRMEFEEFSTEKGKILRSAKERSNQWKMTQLTHTNDAFFASHEMPSFESITYKGAQDKDIQAWLVKPPGFDRKKKYPFLLWIHGGPQRAWTGDFSGRWNPLLYAAAGYVVMMPNPHGSTCFGHEFTAQISGDWAGACYEDVMKAADWAVAEGLADPEKMGAAGGSFGGYMVNWLLGHTDRFKAFVSHAGVYNLESMYGVTEELWFPEWDLKGTPWDDPEGLYAKFSPHKFAARFKTPTLVIHGELDFRVPVAEGFQLFTALQRQGVPSRLLYYPDEGHWITKPKNSKLWNETVLGWFDRYVK